MTVFPKRKLEGKTRGYLQCDGALSIFSVIIQQLMLRMCNVPTLACLGGRVDGGRERIRFVNLQPALGANWISFGVQGHVSAP